MDLVEWAGGTRVTLAIALTDIVGSTSFRAQVGDERMDEVVHNHFTKAEALIDRFGGQLVKTLGDGVMVVFRSVGAALDFACELHQNPGAESLSIRVGIHVGEVNIEARDIAGIEVHIAARLVGSIKGEQIYLTERAKNDIEAQGSHRHKHLRWDQQRKVRFKGFGNRVFSRWALTDVTNAQGLVIPSLPPVAVSAMRRPRRAERPATNIFVRLDERPAIAVLPFTNLGNVEGEAHFADGIVDGIIDELASCRIFPVIARNSSFAFRYQNIEIAEIGRRLDARYIIDGSLIRAGRRMRVAARLVDASSGLQLATERYDGSFNELTEIHNRIAEMIVGSITSEVLRSERHRVANKSANFGSYEYFLRGLEAHYRYTKEDNAIAQSLFRKSIELDKNNASSHALLAHAIIHSVQLGWRIDGQNNYRAADVLARQAIAIDPRLPLAHFALGSTSMFLGRIDQALVEIKEAVRINPSHAAAHAIMAPLLCYYDKPGDALASVGWAIRLSPYDPRLGLWLAVKSQALYFLQNYEEAAAVGQEAMLSIGENPIALRFTAASLGQMGRSNEAEPLVRALRQSSTAPSLSAIKEAVSHLYRNEETIKHLLTGLCKAGFA